MEFTRAIDESEKHEAPARELGVEVSMDAWAYTRLELKNFFLSVITLGVYSAWARVQRRKYVTQHTQLDGHAFDYVASPWVILRSRILVVGIFVASTLAEKLDPSLEIFGSLALVLAFPWAFAASTAFNARQTHYRGHPFVFFGSLRDAYVAFFKSYGLSIITLGIGQFVSAQLFSRFVGNNTSLAGRRFSFDQPRGPYYEVGGALAVSIFVMILSMVLLGFVLRGALGIETGVDELGPGFWIQGGLAAAFCIGYVFVAGAIRATLTNLFYEGLSYGPHAVLCDIKPRTLGGMYLANAAAIVGTLGLAIPWAYMRTYKYRMSCITVLAHGELVDPDAQALSSDGGESDAIGDAFLDIGFDFGV